MLTKHLMILIVLAFSTFGTEAQDTLADCKPNETSYNLPCKKKELDLVDSKITVKIYTKEKLGKMIDRTFVVVHADEENGLDATKQAISENYGRLVEIVSNAPNGKRKRYLYFGVDKKSCIDPNRIYTKKGINDDLDINPCKVGNPPSDANDEIFKFGQKFLDVVTMSNTYNFIVGIHNNMNTLSLNRWSKVGEIPGEGLGEDYYTAYGIFKANDHKNKSIFSTGGNNFVLATNGTIFGKLLENGIYYVALQANREYLTISGNNNQRVLKENLDDGSMSIYFGSTPFKDSGKPFNYLVIEAGYKKDSSISTEQKKMYLIKSGRKM